MSVKRARFIVVSLTDRDGYGFDEHSLPLLVQLVDSSAPDYRTFTHCGPHAFYLATPEARSRANALIIKAKEMRENNQNLTSLGVGSAEGDLLAEFSWLGRLKIDGPIPLGDASIQALEKAKTETPNHVIDPTRCARWS